MKRIITLAASALCALSVSPSALALNVPEIPGATVSLLVKDVNTGEVIYKRNTDDWLQPASTQKLLTALVAKQRLGSSFRYTTSIHQDDRGAVINFSGDPTLSRQDLTRLLQQAYQKNPSIFRGDIYLYNGGFSGSNRAIGLTWDTMGSCYAAPSSGISLDYNCAEAALYRDGEIGDIARLNIPEHHLITVQNSVEIVTKETYFDTLCNIYLDANDNNSYSLTGCQVQHSSPLPLKFAIQNPEKYVAEVIRSDLERLGLPFDGTIYLTQTPADTAALSSHRSASLNTLLARVLQDSNNVVSDSLLRTIGLQEGQGSYVYGSHILRKHLADLFGDTSWLRVPIDDGSGLSRNNRLTVDHLAQVLAYIRRNEPSLMALLPVSGESGTMKYRRSMQEEEFEGRIRAKTGSIYGAINLAGFVTTDSGRELMIVQVVNGNFARSSSGQERPWITFEKALYAELLGM
uniref:D-alanyl-D-alanine carboxypeptidase/D-alanyl-D-alanine endopeptidase n=1 Tax=Thaumasiovibrio occultus TaxID=1891184 RepID=UPI000B35E8A6|nr:D-alanyl-D-alanine carboxypeptidase/D-alanyl-D-alanine-endopeptidase [Thaumasiovibrio occultus]